MLAHDDQELWFNHLEKLDILDEFCIHQKTHLILQGSGQHLNHVKFLLDFHEVESYVLVVDAHSFLQTF